MALVIGLLLTAGTPPAWAEEAPAEKLVNLAFTNAEIRDVLTALAGVGGTSIIADDSVSGKITLCLQDVPFDTALELVVKAKGLAYQQAGPVIVVASAEKLHRGFDSAHVIHLEHARAEEIIGLLSIAAGKSKTDGNEDGKKGGMHAGAAAVNGSGSGNTSASSSVMYTVEGPALVKTEPIQRIQGSGRLRADMETNSILFYGSDAEAEMLRKLAAEIDVPYRQVTVEAEVLAVTKAGVKNLGVEWNWQATPQYVAAGDEDTGSAAAANMGTISYGRSPAGTPYQFLYQAQINALISHNDARLLAKPKVTTLNGRAARIHIGDQIPVASATVSGGATTTSIEYKDAGIILQYTPRIDADGQICASLYTGVSTPVYVADLKAYRIAIREAETEVRMKNGETIVIGGLLNKNDVESTAKIPFLSELPLLGKLFQHHGSANDETEIVIFLTAKIAE